MMLTLVWKEYREHRMVWLVLVMISALTLVGIREVMALMQHVSTSAEDLAALGLVLLSAYGIISGAMMFAGERETGTLTFLDSVSRRRRPLWSAKVLTGLFLNLLMAACVITLILLVGRARSASGYQSKFVMLPIAGLLGFAWGLVGSALARSVLKAVGWTIVLSLGCWLFLWVFYSTALKLVQAVIGSETLVAYGDIALWPFLILAGTAFSGLIFCGPDRQKRFAKVGQRLPVFRFSAVRMTAALTWLVNRQGRAVILAMAVVAAILGLFWPGADFLIWPPAALALAIVCGTTVGGDEQQSDASLFLGDQRMPMGKVWLIKTLLWCLVAIAIALIFLLTGFAIGTLRRLPEFIGENPRELPGRLAWIEPIGIWTILFVPLVYGLAVGQLMSLVLRKQVIAIVVTAFLSILILAVWLPSIVLGIERWQLYIVPLILLAAGRLAIWPWASGRLTTRRPIFELLGCAVLCAAWIAGCLWNRAVSVPDIGDPFNVAAFLAEIPTPEHNQSGRLMLLAYHEFPDQEKKVAAELKRPKHPLYPPPANETGGTTALTYDGLLAEVLAKGWPKKAEELDRWLDLMMEGQWAKRLREAATLPVGMLDDLNEISVVKRSYYLPGFYLLPNTVAGRALQLQARGKNSEALGELVTMLKLSKTVCNHAAPDTYWRGAHLEGTALNGLKQWRKKATAELLRQALDDLTRYAAEAPSAADGIKAQYVIARNQVSAPAAALAGVSAGDPFDWWLVKQMTVVSWSVPWEQDREIRLLKIVCAGELKALETPYWKMVQAPSSKQRSRFPPIINAQSWVAPTPKLAETLSVYGLNELLGANSLQFALVSSPGNIPRDAAQKLKMQTARLELAVDLYKAEKGSLPKSLQDLVPKYIPDVPTSPMTGSPLTLEDIIKSEDGGSATPGPG